MSPLRKMVMVLAAIVIMCFTNMGQALADDFSHEQFKLNNASPEKIISLETSQKLKLLVCKNLNQTSTTVSVSEGSCPIILGPLKQNTPNTNTSSCIEGGTIKFTFAPHVDEVNCTYFQYPQSSDI